MNSIKSATHKIRNKQTMNKYLLQTLLILSLALVPLSGFCACAVDGGVCGDTPTWDPCCNPDRFYCDKEEGADYGTCIPIDEEDEE